MKFVSIARLLTVAALALLLASPMAFARDKNKSKTKADLLYPNATRVEPKLDLPTKNLADKLNKGIEALEAGDDEKAESLLQPLAEGKGNKSKYVQAMALQALANLSYQQDDMDQAISQMREALDIGVMNNETYFQLMYQLVQFYVADEKYAQAGELLSQWRAEGKRETAESYALEGNIDYRLEKYPEAIAAVKKAKELNAQEGKTSNPSSWDQLLAASYAESGNTDEAVELAKERLAADPTDRTTRSNAISLLIQAERYPEAVALMEQARSQGSLQDVDDYTNMAKLYMMIAQSSDDPGPTAKQAVAVLQEGMNNGTIQPGYDVYKLQGDAAYIGEDEAGALAAYEKAAPFASDGELDVRRGQILAAQGKNAEAIRLVQGGIDKGVKDPGTAYIVLGAANANSDNRSAAIAAMKKAAEYPETRDRANRWLQRAGAQ